MGDVLRWLAAWLSPKLYGHVTADLTIYILSYYPLWDLLLGGAIVALLLTPHPPLPPANDTI